MAFFQHHFNSYSVAKVLQAGALLALACSSGMAFSAEDSFRSDACETLLISSQTGAASRALSLVAYLNKLVESGVVTIDQVKRFLADLNQGRVVSLIDEDAASRGLISSIHRQAIEAHLRAGAMDLIILKEWASFWLDASGHIAREQSAARAKTQAVFREMKFHAVPAGALVPPPMRRADSYSGKLTRSFAALSTPVTQSQWVEVMGANPSIFKEGESSVDVIVQGKAVKMQPDHPVENITWWSALEFANRYSVKMGFPPPYDLSGFAFVGHAEDGSLYPADIGSNLANEIRINSRDGRIYRAAGFRLPTHAEHEYFMRGPNGSKASFYFMNGLTEPMPEPSTKEILKRHAWFGLNSGNQTHAVAELEPMVWGDGRFYDVIGNVMEWLSDGMPKISSENEYIVDPLGDQTGITIEYGSRAFSAGWMAGTKWDSVPSVLWRPLRWPQGLVRRRTSGTGLRLVRTLDP